MDVYKQMAKDAGCTSEDEINQMAEMICHREQECYEMENPEECCPECGMLEIVCECEE